MSGNGLGMVSMTSRPNQLIDLRSMPDRCRSTGEVPFYSRLFSFYHRPRPFVSLSWAASNLTLCPEVKSESKYQEKRKKKAKKKNQRGREEGEKSNILPYLGMVCCLEESF